MLCSLIGCGVDTPVSFATLHPHVKPWRRVSVSDMQSIAALLETCEKVWHAGSSHRIRRGFVDSDRVPTEDELNARPAFCAWYMQNYSRTQQKWIDLYCFTERADLQPDFVMMNFWIANHHSSRFREV